VFQEFLSRPHNEKMEKIEAASTRGSKMLISSPQGIFRIFGGIKYFIV
jgi:hypothetical protein